jgi:hypothetical protein
VQVAHVDIDRRELDFRVVKRLGHPGSLRKLPPKRRGGGRGEKPARGNSKKSKRRL